METTKVTVKSVKLFRKEINNGMFFDVQLQLKEQINGYQFDGDGNYIATNVENISIPRPQFTTEVCDAYEPIAIYRASRESGFDQKALGVLFTGSTLEIVRTHHKKDEEVLDNNGNPVKNDKDEVVTYSRDCYTTNITGVTLSKVAEKMLERWLENAL